MKRFIFYNLHRQCKSLIMYKTKNGKKKHNNKVKDNTPLK